MSEATVTSKGQVTIPSEIRQGMSLTAGKRVMFTRLSDGTTVMRPKTKSILELKGTLRNAGKRRKVDIGDMNIGRR